MSTLPHLRRLLGVHRGHLATLTLYRSCRHGREVVSDTERIAADNASQNEALWVVLMEQCLRQDSPGECLELNAQWKRLWRPSGW